MDHFKYLIIGGGMVAGYAAKEMGKQGISADELCLISADTVAPYQRPPLSKDYFEDEKPLEKVFINKDSLYQEKGIHLQFPVTVEQLDLQSRQVQTTSAGAFSYEKLLLATGSTPRKLHLRGADMEGIFYLRSLDNCQHIKQAAASATGVVVVGGGFIGTELAARLADKGPRVSLAYREQKLLDFFFTPELSELYESRYRDHEVELIPDAEVVEFLGGDRLSGVRLADGTEVAADMAVVGVGVTPNVELFESTGLKLDGGVVVNEYLETSEPDVYAAGDIARWPVAAFDRAMRFEHEDHARNSGRHVARVMLGQREPYDYLPMFWSEVYDVSWEFWGLSRGADEVVYRGDLEAADFSVWWLKGGALIGAMATENRHDTEGEAAQRLIREHAKVEAAALRDESKPVE